MGRRGCPLGVRRPPHAVSLASAGAAAIRVEHGITSDNTHLRTASRLVDSASSSGRPGRSVSVHAVRFCRSVRCPGPARRVGCFFNVPSAYPQLREVRMEHPCRHGLRGVYRVGRRGALDYKRVVSRLGPAALWQRAPARVEIAPTWDTTTLETRLTAYSA